MGTREERIERLQERHTNRAEKAERESAARFKYVDAMAGVMNGQPILIGHHSEKRHRRDLERMHSAIGKGVEASKLAEHSRGLAAGADDTGISIEDSDAQQLLAEKIAGLEEKQAQMKAANRIIRRKPKNEPTEAKVAKLTELYGFKTDKTARRMFEPDFCGRVGFPSYMLSNNNANIKRCKDRQVEIERIDAIEDDQEVAAGTCEGKSFRFVTDTADQRLRFEAPRLSKDACQILRRNGFKWSRNRGCWVRLLNLNAIVAAKHWAAKELARLEA